MIQKKQQERKLIEDTLATFIDFYIRTRPQFHSGKPLTFQCPLSDLQQELAVKSNLKKLNQYLPISLEGYLRLQDRFILDKSQEFVQLKYKTPFRGSHEVFFMIGHFSCYKCKKKWKDDESMVDQLKKCPKCEALCYPYLQLPHAFQQDRLPTSEESHAKVAHDCTSCTKCQELGRICIPTMYYASNDHNSSASASNPNANIAIESTEANTRCQ